MNVMLEYAFVSSELSTLKFSMLPHSPALPRQRPVDTGIVLSAFGITDPG